MAVSCGGYCMRCRVCVLVSFFVHKRYFIVALIFFPHAADFYFDRSFMDSPALGQRPAESKARAEAAARSRPLASE